MDFISYIRFLNFTADTLAMIIDNQPMEFSSLFDQLILRRKRTIVMKK
jgi:hypothetical protein